MLKVLGRLTSLNARKVLWASDEMGLAYEREDWGMPLRDPQVPEFLQLNPNGLVPVIIDDGFVLWESNPIMVYLAGQCGSPLLPTELRKRAVMEQWLSWETSELAPAWHYAVMALVRRKPGYDDKDQLAGSIRRWSDRMIILERELTRYAHVAGEDFTLADIAIGLSVHRWFSTPFQRPDLPAMVRYYSRLRARSASAPYLDAANP